MSDLDKTDWLLLLSLVLSLLPAGRIFWQRKTWRDRYAWGSLVFCLVWYVGGVGAAYMQEPYDIPSSLPAVLTLILFPLAGFVVSLSAPSMLGAVLGACGLGMAGFVFGLTIGLLLGFTLALVSLVFNFNLPFAARAIAILAFGLGTGIACALMGFFILAFPGAVGGAVFGFVTKRAAQLPWFRIEKNQ